MNNLTSLTIADARDALKKREIKAVELTQSYLDAINKGNDSINAYVSVTAEKALSQAAKSDENIQNGQMGMLEGIPIGVKDIFATRDIHTQACSHILDGFKPPYESTVTENLWQDGAVLLGKLNMDELAMGSSNESSYYGNVINPWRQQDSDRALVPGGSSGGSAAAVAAQLCAGATGTDTGGSIRQPSAFTATVGLKPTYGRCSRWGTIAFASSLDQAGPITRDVRDCAIMLESMASYDTKDSTSVDLPVPHYEEVLGQSVKGLKIGIPKEFRLDTLSSEIVANWEHSIAILKEAGAEIVEVSLPHNKYALPAYYIIAPAEASSNFARFDGVRYGLRVDGDSIDDMYKNTRSEGFGHKVKCRVLIGTYVLSAGYYDAYYLRAQKVRALIKQDFDQCFANGVDMILTPTAPSPAFAIADEEFAKDPVAMYLNDVFTVAVNLAGLPAISVPSGLSQKGLPLGLQLIGRPFDEAGLLKAGFVMEQAIGKFSPQQWW